MPIAYSATEKLKVENDMLVEVERAKIFTENPIGIECRVEKNTVFNCAGRTIEILEGSTVYYFAADLDDNIVYFNYDNNGTMLELALKYELEPGEWFGSHKYKYQNNDLESYVTFVY